MFPDGIILRDTKMILSHGRDDSFRNQFLPSIASRIIRSAHYTAIQRMIPAESFKRTYLTKQMYYDL